MRGIDEDVEPFKEEDRRWSSQKVTLHESAARWIMRRVIPYFVVSSLVLGGVCVLSDQSLGLLGRNRFQ